MSHTDRDARWTKKHGKSFYGYKLRGNVDARYKLIRRVAVTPANVDDGQTLDQVLDASNTGKRVLADEAPADNGDDGVSAESRLRNAHETVPR